MPCNDHILISLKPQYFQKVLIGNKTVELRRRPVRVAVGTTVWIYETVPSGRLGARAMVANIVEGTPSEIWARFRREVGISEEDFSLYFQGADYACAVVLTDIVPLAKRPALSELRLRLGAFVAPQFYRRLSIDSPEVLMFRSLASAVQ